MDNVVKFIFLLIAGLSHKMLITSEPDWTYDIVSVDVENKTPDNVNIELHVTRRARGIFSVSGIADFKKEVTDELFIAVAVYYSYSGSYFAKSPFHIPKLNFSTIMDTFYKDLIMESFLNCSENGPIVEEKFVSPLSNRVVYINDCLASNENMPSKMKSGYYKIVFDYTNESEGSVEMLVKVEPK